MKKISRVIGLCMAGVLTVSLLSGCGGNKPTGNNGANSDSSYTIEAKGSPYAEGIMMKELEDPTVIYMTNTTWEFITQENKENAPTPIYHAMTIWKEVYGQEVTIDLVDWDSYTDHLITATASGAAPDVMRYYEQTRHPVWAVRNLIAPLEDYMSLDDPDYDLEYSKRYSIGGKYYALFGKAMPLPFRTIVYNKTKIKQSGQKTPIEYAAEGQWNWTNFVNLCKAMTNASKNDYGLTGWNYGTDLALPLAYIDAEGKIVNNIDNADYRSMYGKLYDLLKLIEKAIQASDIGINPTNDGNVLRLAFPQLTEERRKELCKSIKKYGEDCKVAIRSIRRDTMDKLKAMKKNSEITEDDLKDCEKKVQDLTDKFCADADKAVADKEKEIMTV